MIFYLVLVVHVIACIMLVAVILLQAGKGGGLTDTFGGGAAQSVLGSRAGDFLTKATAVCAVLFILTSLSLALLSAQRNKSLLQDPSRVRKLEQDFQEQAQKEQPAATAQQATDVEKTIVDTKEKEATPQEVLDAVQASVEEVQKGVQDVAEKTQE